MPFTYEFPRPNLTVDAIILTDEPASKVLLIQRKYDPFAGRWALPGGFVHENEPLEAAVRRELHEETGLRVGELRQCGAAGDPGRDPRGWTVTILFRGRVSANPPEVHGDDDAAQAAWFPLQDLPPLAFDHAKILAELT